MKKFNKIMISSLSIVLLCSGLSNFLGLSSNIQTVYASTAKISKKKLQPSDDYPDINSKFDVNNMNQYSDDDLFTGVLMKNFYIKDIGGDKMKQYHILLTPNKKSKSYFLAVTKSKKRLIINKKITVTAILQSHTKINSNQINSGISSKYYNKKAILIDIDQIQK